MAIFSISSNNYMPYSRTLIDSSNAAHPDADHYLCLADEVLPVSGYYPEDCVLVPVHTLGIPDFPGFAFRYDIMEFNTAAKPYMFLHLFAMGYEQVVYFDPDIKVYRPITPVFAALDAGASVVLTPHLTRPAETETPPDDITVMKAGIYNLGFVAFGQREGVEEVLRWWCRRLRYQCINAQGEGIFVDQKFIDLVPGFLPDVAILRQTTLNAAYWNLFQREFDHDGTHWQVDGAPLIFFHFSGYDPRNSHQLSKHTALFASDNSDELNSLLSDYQSDLFARGLKQTPRANYAYGHFAGGAPIPTFVRHMFRETFLTWNGDPFETYEAHLGRMALGTPAGPDGAVCTNLMRYFWEASPYLRNTYDIHDPAGVAGLVTWFIRHGHGSGIDPRLLHRAVDRIDDSRRRRRQHVPPRERPEEADVSVIGYLTANTGVAEAGRQTLRTVAAGTRSVEGVDVTLNVVSARGDESAAAFLTDRACGRVQIFHVNADQLPLVQEDLRDRLRDEAYRIAVPFWELADFPQEWIAAFDRVDEIWAPTRFIQNTLVTKLDKPVLRMPIALDFDAGDERFTRSHYGLPDGRFIFLFSFDFLSFSGRKNPRAVLDAFTMAFAGRSFQNDVTLAIKCVNSSFAAAEMDALRRVLDVRMDIHFLDRELSRVEMLGLVGAVDCVVSLHRSEGLGLLVAEAMALGVPVIATDYSATTELVSPKTGYPVDYRLIPLKAGEYPFAAGQVWADPDLSHAAWQMRFVVEQQGRNTDMIARAKAHITDEYGTAAVVRLQAARFETLGI